VEDYVAKIAQDEVSLYALRSGEDGFMDGGKVGKDNLSTLLRIKEFLNGHTCEYNPVCESLRSVAGLQWDPEKLYGSHTCTHKNHMVCDALRAAHRWTWPDPETEGDERVMKAEDTWLKYGLDLAGMGYCEV
jgi:hypothetical protein